MVLISSQYHQRKQQGAKSNFYPSFFLLPFVSRLCAESGWQMSPPFLHFELQKKRNNVFILYRQCGSLCGKRGGDSHVALRYLFTLTRTNPTLAPAYTLLCPRRHLTQARHTIRATSITSLSNPNFFLHNLRFTQIRLICQISISAHFQIGLIPHKLTISVPISLDLCLPSFCSKILRKNLRLFRAKCETLFLLELTLLEQKAAVLQSA